VRYYCLVGDLMMAHLKDRPVSLVRAPSGVEGQLFFQKHTETEKLPGIRQLDPALYSSHPSMLEIADKQGILSAAQWNVVEFHTLNTGTKSLQHPVRMILDLDPGEGVAWDKVRDAASLVRAFLKELGLPAFLKTSGGKGLHVVVPLRAAHDWDSVKGFSQAMVIHLAKTIPQRFVARSGPKNRVGKIFIDYLRNGVSATTACAWSARARPGLGISVPVAWEELASLTGGDHWTVRSAHARLDQGNRAWDGYARSACSLTAAMKILNYPAGAPASPF
jgi:bifunctional non-homologous end joining protein LigD